jgi:hypothetical protein
MHMKEVRPIAILPTAALCLTPFSCVDVVSSMLDEIAAAKAALVIYDGISLRALERGSRTNSFRVFYGEQRQ